MASKLILITSSYTVSKLMHFFETQCNCTETETELSLIGGVKDRHTSSVVQNTFKKYFNYKLQISFSNCVSNTFLNYFGKVVENTKYKIRLAKVIKIQNTFDCTYAKNVLKSLSYCNISKKI